MRMTLVGLSLLVVASLAAAKTWQPFSACRAINVKYAKQTIVLNTNIKTNKSRIYVFNNISGQNLWLDHPVLHPSASAGWSSQLNSKHWSALVLTPDNTNFVMTCATIQPGKISTLSCKQYVKVCQLQNAQMSQQNSGNFWAAENLSLQNLLQRLKERKLV